VQNFFYIKASAVAKWITEGAKPEKIGNFIKLLTIILEYLNLYQNSYWNSGLWAHV
jgi:hypothetical protein